ncbi:hypothetical protein [Citricoccus nitrophenolicus]|uniref:hypothetical protein n=1 Tax=Citricoccus nitrophenolicus TaxID=863575 RepID=UPI0039B42F84
MNTEPTTDATPTTADATTTTATAPLPAGHLACRSCGVAVRKTASARPHAASIIGRDGASMSVPLAPGQRPRPVPTVKVLKCADCTDREEYAARLLADHPRAAYALGGGAALHRLGAVLDALAATGRPMPDRDSLTSPELVALARNLTAPGVALQWVTRFSPVVVKGAELATCAAYPWAHMDEDRRSGARSGYAAVLAERIAAKSGPVELSPPPVDGATRETVTAPGCLLCGVGTVNIDARQVVALGGREVAAGKVWRPRAVTAGALGGRRRSRDEVRGHVCPPCADALDTVGALGVTAMERALRLHLTATGRKEAARNVKEGETFGLVGFSELVFRAHLTGQHRPAANGEPWDHVKIGDDR